MEIAELSKFAELLLDPAHKILSSGYGQLVRQFAQNNQLRALVLRDGVEAALASDVAAIKELQKQNKEFVTAAEAQAEGKLRELVQDRFPEHEIVGEELGRKKGKAFTWVFDPVDGTSAMVRSAIARAFNCELGAPVPAFGMTIAVLSETDAVVGVVGELCPDGDGLSMPNIWVGSSARPTTRNGKQIVIAETHNFKKAVLACTVPEVMFATPDAWSGFQALLDSTGSFLPDQNCIGFMKLLDGSVDIVIERDLTLPDAAALIPILSGAGVVVTDHDGKPVSFDSTAREKEYCILAALPKMHSDALFTVLRGVPENANRFESFAITQGYPKKFPQS